jgi:hypothetical protein
MTMTKDRDEMHGHTGALLASLLLGAGALAACSSSDDNKTNKPVQTIVSTVFTTDPTLQDSNGDGIYDWVIRDRESDHFAQDPKFSIVNGVFRSEGGDSGGDCLDSRPRMDYPNHTEFLWSARSLNNKDFDLPTVGQIYTSWVWVGAQAWINFDYDVPNAHWAAVFGMVYKRATDQVLFLVNQVDEAVGSTNLIYKILYVQAGLPPDDFVNVKLHLYIPEKMIGVNVNGVDQGKVPYELKYEAAAKDDRFVTIFPPQGTAEYQMLVLQVAEP